MPKKTIGVLSLQFCVRSSAAILCAFAIFAPARLAALPAPTFVRAYRGATSSNHRPSWSWNASGATDYLVTLTSSAQVATVATNYSPPADLADGVYVIQVRARAGGVASEPASDTIKIVSTRAGNGEPDDKIYGVAAVEISFLPGQEIRDATGLRFKFRVNADQSATIKIVFAWTRLYGLGSVDTYLVETNVYSQALFYNDGLCTLGQITGTPFEGRASARLAVPNYVGYDTPSKVNRVAARTSNGSLFPLQTYYIDNILGLWKRDAVSQSDIQGRDGEFIITRGNLVSDLGSWASACSGALDQNVSYRQWTLSVTIDGLPPETMTILLPDAAASYLSPNELADLTTEFLHQSGLYQLYYWDFMIQREFHSDWQPLTRLWLWRYDGYEIDFGAKRSVWNGKYVLEFSNDGPGSFLPLNSFIDLSGTPALTARHRAVGH